MWSFSSIRKDPDGAAGTLRLLFDPRKKVHGIFGTVTDVSGRRWDLRGQSGDKLFARPWKEDYWTSTATNPPGADYSGIHHGEWRCYNVEIVEKS